MFTSITEIKKRSGEVVSFDPKKIMVAVSKAYSDVFGKENEMVLGQTLENVLKVLEISFKGLTPSVEDVQNIVERELMGLGQFEVAKAYIIYRYEHAKVREVKKQETLKKLETGGFYITKRDGTKQPFYLDELKKDLIEVLGDLAKQINIEAVIKQVRLEIYEDMKTSDIDRAVVMVLRSYIEKDSAYSKAAAKAHLASLYRHVLGSKPAQAEVGKALIEHFPKAIAKGVSIGKLDPRMLTFDLQKLASGIKPERDDLLSYLSVQTLTDRYFTQDPVKKETLETPQIFWMRVAMGLALNEANKEDKALEFYEVISTLHFVPSTPTLFHAGTAHPQLSSCYLTTVEDSLDHIFKCIGDNAQLSKWSGGLGNDWTNLRGTGALIKGTGVESQGIIPFLKIANDTTVAINRSGKRRGATCAYLETWHWDIEDFLELRKNTGDERRRTHDMNVANWIPDLLMKRVKADGMWTLFSPEEVPDLHHIYGKAFETRYEHYEAMAHAGQIRLHKEIRARDLWKKMLTQLFETGHPWITFKDPCNVRSPQDHAGVVHSSNLCTEITLNTSAEETAVCNLGSVNLARHITNGKLDEAKLAQTVSTGMRMLDNVIDLCFYPTEEAKRSNMRHRPVGLGIMGFQDALYQLGINFDSEAMVEFSDYSMEVISYHAIFASSKLAAERGTYSSFRGSKWDRGLLPQDTLDLLEQERGVKIDVSRSGKLDWSLVRNSIKQFGMRNSNCMAIAPTATISNISNCVPAMEPIYKNIYVKANQSGDFTIVNEYLVEELKKIGMWNDEMLSKLKYFDGRITQIIEIPQIIRDRFKEVFEVDSKWLIKAAAYRGKWIDQSQSLNIFYSGHSGKDLNDIYLYAWEMGLKTTYYLRTMAATQVEKSTVSTATFGATHLRKEGESATAPEVTMPQAELAPVLQALANEAVSQNMENRMEKVEIVVEEEVKPVYLAGDPNATIMIDGKAVKLCKVNDPDCEACQ